MKLQELNEEMKVDETSDSYMRDVQDEVWKSFRKKLNAEQQKQALKKFNISSLADAQDFGLKELEKFFKYLMKLEK